MSSLVPTSTRILLGKRCIGKHKLQNGYQECMYVIIGHKMDENMGIVYVVNPINGGFVKWFQETTLRHVNKDEL